MTTTHKQTLVSFDWAMKKLLRSKANFSILEGFLSELLKRDIKILELSESESNKTHEDDKQNRVDVLVKSNGDEIILIEVQFCSEYDFFHRMLYGTSKIVTDHMTSGAKYGEVKKVYSINILYFDLGHGEDYIYHGTTSFTGLHKHDKLRLSKAQQDLYKKELVHEIYPEYYLLKVNQFNDVAKDTLDQWIYFLKNSEIKSDFNAKGLSEAGETLKVMNLSPEEARRYERHLKNVRIEAGMIETRNKNSYDEGRAEGEKAGLEKGKLATAKKLKKLGVDLSVIIEVTGLTAEEIEKA
jgi:predicted transposase/invertase (TIGR01784 family)